MAIFSFLSHAFLSLRTEYYFCLEDILLRIGTVISIMIETGHYQLCFVCLCAALFGECILGYICREFDILFILCRSSSLVGG